MDYKIGKVIDYDGYSGNIINSDSSYFFTETDVIGNVQNGDYVKFKDEQRKDKRAFFVEKINISEIA